MTTLVIAILIVAIAYMTLAIGVVVFEQYTINHNVSSKTWILADDLIHLVFFDYKHFF